MQDTSTEAKHGLPDGLILRTSSICNAGFGVFTAPDYTLRKNTIFGPYAGVMVMSQIEAHESGYCWQVIDGLFVVFFLLIILLFK